MFLFQSSNMTVIAYEINVWPKNRKGVYLRQAINDLGAEPKKLMEYWDARNRGKKKQKTTTRRTMTRPSSCELSVYFSRSAVISILSSLKKHSLHTWLKETCASLGISISLLNFPYYLLWFYLIYSDSEDPSTLTGTFVIFGSESNKIRILKFNSNLLAYYNCFSDHLPISMTEGRRCNRIYELQKLSVATHLLHWWTHQHHQHCQDFFFPSLYTDMTQV